MNGLLTDYLLEMKTLVLFRHGKSSWDHPLDDIDRPLILKGIKRIINVSIKNKNIFNKSKIIMTSPANRAVHTAFILARETNLGYNRILINESLYTFSSRSLESAIRSISDKFDYVIFVGHNPAFTEIINKLTNLKIDNMRTASWAKIIFNEKKWSDISVGRVKLCESIK